jgi:uncharacterized protein (TIGR04255 family)
MKQAPASSLPAYPREEFENAQLAFVAARVAFPPLTRLQDAAARTRFQEELRREYPLYAEEPLRRGIIPDAVPTPDQLVYRYSSIDGSWSVVVSSEFAALECRNGYRNIEEMLSRITIVWHEIERNFEPGYQLRLDLRFVNELRHPEWKTYDDWRGLLNPDLMGFDPRNWLLGEVRQTATELLADRGDKTFLLIRRGFLRGSTVKPLTEDAPRKTEEFYLLDFDCYAANAQEFQANPTQMLREFDDVLYQLFRRTIHREDQKLYRWLKEPK